MTSFQSPSKFPSGVATSSNVRVVHSASDPADEVRATLASLTARAQQLVSTDTDHRVVSQGRSLYELSKKTAEETRQQVRKSTVGDLYPASQASVELFMAKHLGFDVQDQQRLLHQLQSSNAQLVSDMSNAHAATVVGGDSGFQESDRHLLPGGEVDALVAKMKGEILARNEHVVHHREKEQLQRQEYAVMKAGWSSFSVGMSDNFEMLSLRNGGGAESHTAGTMARINNKSAVLRSSTSFVNVLSSGSQLADEVNRKVAAFAPIVQHNAPAQWIKLFSAYVMDQARTVSGDDISSLWSSVEQMLDPVQRQGSSATTLSYVASSRMVLERKSLSRLLVSTMRIDPSRFEEVANMHTSRVMELIVRRSSTTNAWVHIFDAMRVGRYDVAHEVAKRVGNTALEAALQKYASVTPDERSALQPMVDLRDLYAEAATKEDSHRQVVLFLLLAGSVGESSDVTLRTLTDLCSQVAQSLEDALWIRLCCVRGVEESGKCDRVQSLAFMQKVILEDLPDLVTMVHGNIPRLASFLLHALLPCSGLRLLLENDATYVDGFHIALCFNQCDLLESASQEAPLDLSRHIGRYCTLVLLDADRRYVGCATAGSSIFSYFHKMGFDEAFVEFSMQDLVVTRLFGSRGSVEGQHDGLLTITPDLMKAMTNIAELAVVRNNVPVALHVLLALTRAACGTAQWSVVRHSLQRAVQIVSPAMAQVFPLPPYASYVSQLLTQAGQLRDTLRALPSSSAISDSESVLPPSRDLKTFEMLCTMADLYVAEANGSLEHALTSFFSLPFVPSTGEDIERCVREFGLVSSHIVAAVAALLAPVLRSAAHLIELYIQEGNQQGASYYTQSSLAPVASNSARVVNTRLLMKVVVEWLRRCSTQSSAGSTVYQTCASDINEFEKSYLV